MIELPPLYIPIPRNVRGDGLALVSRETLERARRAAAARERILLARIAELEADAERYRWLRSQVRFELPNQRDSWTTPSGVYLVATMVSAVYGDCGEQTDAAIDAARKA